MSKDDEKVIMYDSDEAATHETRTITKWWSRHGGGWADSKEGEHFARYDGCTHRKCEKCGEVYEKNSYCKSCVAANRRDRFNELPVIDWNGKCMVYSEALDEYFQEPILAVEAGDEHGLKPSELMLTECKRLALNELSSDRWYDELHEDDSAIKEIEGLIEKFNEELAKIETNTWYPGKRAINVKEWEDVH